MADSTGSESPPSLTALVGGIVNDLQQLIRQELQLARTEVKQEVDKVRTAAVSRAKMSDLCRASYPITTCRPGPSTAARPAAARITVTRFIRLGPAPSSPLSPAVPNSSLLPKRSRSSASSPESSSATNSARVSGSGSCASHS